MTIRNAWTAICLSLIFAIGGCVLKSTPSTDPNSLPFWGFALDGHPLTEEHINAIEKETGIKPRIVVFFLQWPPPGNNLPVTFPEETLNAIWNGGAIPCLTWEPMYYEGGKEITVPYGNILEGSYDPYILEFARRVRDWKKPFMIRFAHEMNIDRYHWGTERNAYGPDSPHIYRRMYRYVVDLFRLAGAGNALWVFCPNAESVPDISYSSHAGWNRATNYYPGDDYVDILGMDGYNWGNSRTKEQHGWDSKWQSFEEIFASLYNQLRLLAPDKPLFVFETASVSQGGDKTAWIGEAFKTAAKWRLRGIVWFQVRKEEDWRLQSGAELTSLRNIGENDNSPQTWLRGYLK